MARLGILSVELERNGLEANLDAIKEHGIGTVQYHIGSAVPGVEKRPAVIRGWSLMAPYLTPELVAQIHDGFLARDLNMAAVDGTYNMIDPDLDARATGAAALHELIGFAPALGTSIVTLASGTRNPDSMWTPDPGSYTGEAWADLLVGMAAAASRAEEMGITLAVEPELGNVVNSPAAARRLMDEIASPNLKVLFDAANIFKTGDLARMHDHLKESFDLVGDDIAIAHAKDLDHDGGAGHLPVGHGELDYDIYLGLLAQSGFDGAVILHQLSIPEDEYAQAFAYVRGHAPAGFLTS